MMLDYFQNVVTGIEAKLAAGDQPYVARKMLTMELSRLGVHLYDGQHRVAWCGIATPYDLLSALDITPCFVEFVGASLASGGMVGPLLEAAEQGGFSTDACAYHRSVLAADTAGLMPVPDFVIGTSSPCSGGLGVIQEIARRHGTPIFVVHVPPDSSEASVAYLADQYRAMVAFAEEHLGTTLDAGRMHEAMTHAETVRQRLLEIYELAAAIPSPARRRDMVNLGITLPLMSGTATGPRIADAYRDELTAKLAARIAARNGGGKREPVRLLWLQNRIQFRNNLEQVLDEEFGAVVVADELNDVTWDAVDPDDPYEGIARRALTFPLMLSPQHRVDHLATMVRRYDIDGVINPCHWGCRQGTGTRGMIQDGLRAHGVPVLNLEVDCVDQRNYSEGQLRTRLEAFVEMLG
jgi:benzoyl-CoA reductase/2-hydroxyglutaryl-CoA dehydratase subunit BcrC/BadD/HgdB